MELHIHTWGLGHMGLQPGHMGLQPGHTGLEVQRVRAALAPAALGVVGLVSPSGGLGASHEVAPVARL